MTDTLLHLTTRQRWILTAILCAVIVPGVFDVAEDLGDGATWRHVAVEGCGLFAAGVAVVWIWLNNQKLTATTKRLDSGLALATAEAQAWKAKSDSLVKGLGAAIDAQLGQWGLSAAEKEVALLLLKGLSLKEVSEARGTSERTTRQQAQDVYRKSGLSGRAEFAAFFLEDLLLPRTDP